MPSIRIFNSPNHSVASNRVRTEIELSSFIAPLDEAPHPSYFDRPHIINTPFSIPLGSVSNETLVGLSPTDVAFPYKFNSRKGVFHKFWSKNIQIDV